MTFLIHGWNDNLAQWRNVQRNLQEEWGHPVHLFAYESLDDMATIQLLARRFHAFVQEHTDTTGLKKQRERLERGRWKREKEQREKELKEQRWQEKQRKKKQRAIDPGSLEISNPTNFMRVHRYDLASLSSDQQLQIKDATKQKIVSSDNETLLQIIASHGLDLKEWKALLHKLAAYEGLPFKTIFEQSLAIEDFLLQKRAMLNEQATRLREKKDKLMKAGRECKDMLVEASREQRDRLMQSGREKKERILEVS
ncbi:putative differentiation regulator [Balamuthia mandrillaris]